MLTFETSRKTGGKTTKKRNISARVYAYLKREKEAKN
jgi:hypothetical protein